MDEYKAYRDQMDYESHLESRQSNIPVEYKKLVDRRTGYYSKPIASDYRSVKDLKIEDKEKIELLEHLIFGHTL